MPTFETPAHSEPQTALSRSMSLAKILVLGLTRARSRRGGSPVPCAGFETAPLSTKIDPNPIESASALLEDVECSDTHHQREDRAGGEV
jgi:hypothetical protein